MTCTPPSEIHIYIQLLLRQGQWKEVLALLDPNAAVGGETSEPGTEAKVKADSDSQRDPMFSDWVDKW